MNASKIARQQPATPRLASAGFSIIEMLVAVTIIGILSAFALPAYNDYVQSSEEASLTASMATIEVFQEDYRLRTGGYAVNLADKAAIAALLDWDPRDNNPDQLYSIANSTDTTVYQMTGTSPTGLVLCIEFPSKQRC